MYRSSVCKAKKKDKREQVTLTAQSEELHEIINSMTDPVELGDRVVDIVEVSNDMIMDVVRQFK